VFVASHWVRLSLVVAVGMLVAPGCGSDGLEMFPVRGEVSYQGKPLTRGIVTYVPTTAGAGRTANGPIQPDGTFEMTTQKRGDGVTPGTYNIVIYSDEEDPNQPRTREEIESQGAAAVAPKLLVPEKYLSSETSGLSDTVDNNHSGFKKIELQD
jgi:hypothetical protein